MSRPTPQDIIEMLEEPVEDRRPIVRRIQRHAQVGDLIAALQSAAAPLTREILCDILGYRHSRRAVPVLLDTLTDPCRRVRRATAIALGNIQSPKAGPVLLIRFENEDDMGVKAWIASALGGVGYLPAVPKLISALASDDRDLRYLAAWSLGALRAQEAEGPLQQALVQEPVAAVHRHMQEALNAIREARGSG